MSFSQANLTFSQYTIFHTNIVFPTEAEHSYFSADFRLKLFL